MRRSIGAVCVAAVACLWLMPAFAQTAAEVPKEVQGAWTAAKATRDGKAAREVVGNRLSIAGNRFQIQS